MSKNTIENLTRRAEMGDVQAMVELGKLYFEGVVGLATDYNAAAWWFGEAARHGNVIAARYLAELYRDNLVPSDDHFSDALYWFEEAASGGDYLSMRLLGDVYNSMGNYKDAKYWYILASEAGDSGAGCTLGKMYKFGAGVEQDFSESKYWLEKAIHYHEAKKHLADLYYNGWGVQQDYGKAIELYQGAETDGNVDATVCLGNMHYFGLGFVQNFEEAARSYKRAALKNNALAMTNLGVMCELGLLGKIDFIEAVAWYKKACEGDCGYAILYLANMYHRGDGIKQDNKVASELWEKAALLGSSDGMYARGKVSYFGPDVFKGSEIRQSYQQAEHWFKLAAFKGHVEAMQMLTKIYSQKKVRETLDSSARIWNQKIMDARKPAAVSPTPASSTKENIPANVVRLKFKASARTAETHKNLRSNTTSPQAAKSAPSPRGSRKFKVYEGGLSKSPSGVE